MNPLFKRTPRELRNNFGKYLGIFLLMFACVAMVSGFLMAAHSISVIGDNMRNDYNIEDGRLTSAFEASDEQLDAAAKCADDVGGMAFYENFSITVPFEQPDGDNSANRNIRVTSYQESFNIAAYTEGSAPSAANEIALDRVFAKNNAVSLGDTISLDGIPFTVCGIMTEADSQALFENNSDFTLNAMTFGVAQASEAGMSTLREAGRTPTYTYSFCFTNRSLSVAQRTDIEKDMMEALSDEGAQLTSLIDASANQAIGYASEDVEGDSSMMEALLYIIVVIMAFAFVVLSSSTIEEESAVIGTLLASGYRRREILIHYMTLPCLVGLIACVAGSVCGVTLLESPMKDLYYNSYSLPPYQLSWDWGIFARCALLPLAVLAAITFLGILRKMGHTPLQFLRHETSKAGARRAFRLPERLGFMARFRLRVFLCNMGNFVTLFIGISFASLLLLFGLAVLPTMTHYADNLRNNMVAEHQYNLKAPLELKGSDEDREAWKAVDKLLSVDSKVLGKMEDAADDLKDASDAFKALPSVSHAFDMLDIQDTLQDGIKDVADELGLSIGETNDLIEQATDLDYDDDDVHPINTTDNGAEKIAQAEKYAVYSLEYDRGGDNGKESVTIYGIAENSRYWHELQVGDGAIVIGNGMIDKFGFAPGDTISLYDKYEDKSHDFTLADGNGASWGSKSDMSVYMSLDDFNRVFDHEANYFNAYASDEELELDTRYLESDLTPAGMDKIGDQMTNSMGGMMDIVTGLAVFIYLVFMYLLTKSIIDRSARSISYMKVFGYRNREISRLYLRSITSCVVVSLLACMPIITGALSLVFKAMLLSYSGNIEIHVPDYAMAECFLIGIASYAAVAMLQMRTIRRVPLAIALKVQE